MDTPAKVNPMAIVAYLLFFVPLLTNDNKDPFVNYHVRQGFGLFMAAIVVQVIDMILPYNFWMLEWLLGVLILALLIKGMMTAATGKKEPLPLIGKMAEEIKI